MTNKKFAIPLLPVPDGYRVRIQHNFDPKFLEASKDNYAKAPKYFTHARLFNPDGALVASANAWCNPSDSPSRKKGRAIAHNRVIQVWEEYANGGQ